jgi:hypothetical protein
VCEKDKVTERCHKSRSNPDTRIKEKPLDSITVIDVNFFGGKQVFLSVDKVQESLSAENKACFETISGEITYSRGEK